FAKTQLLGQITTRFPIRHERLARTTPEQRARLEAALKARSDQNTRSNTYKTCETKEKLQKAPFEDKQQCTETIISSTSSHAELNVECTDGEIKTSVTLKVAPTVTRVSKAPGT